MHRNGIRNHFVQACCSVCAVVIAWFGTGLRASAQTASTDLSFEVATIKPVLMDVSHPFNPKHFWAHISPSGASYWSMTLDSLIAYAYDVQPVEFKGPEWANADHYDIDAKFPDGADKKDQRKMLQALLKERFKLSFHVEKKELDGYLLVIGKHGERLRPSLPDPATPENDAALKPGDSSAEKSPAKSEITKNKDGSSTVDMGKRGTQTIKFDQENWAMHYEESKMTMEELAGRLSNCLGSGTHKVEDRTGIKGNYQIAYDCPSPAPRPQISSDTAATIPSDPLASSPLIRSLDALGLKLERRKMLQDVCIVDHVERPSEN